MDFRKNPFSSRKEILTVIVAGGILVAIFAPSFQRADALSLTVTGLNGAAFDTSSPPFSFTIELNIRSGEQIQIRSISVWIDGTPVSAFDMFGNQVFGHPNGVVTLGKPNAPFDTTPNCGPPVTEGSTATTTTTTTTTGKTYTYGYGYSTVTSSRSVTSGGGIPALAGPSTIIYPASIKPSLLSNGTHSLQVIINTAAGSNLLSTPVSFTVTHPDGTASVRVFSKHLSNNSDIQTPVPIQLRKGITLLQTKFTNSAGQPGPVEFTLNAREPYFIHALELGNLTFHSWSTGDTERIVVGALDQGQNQSLIAYYIEAPAPPIRLSISAKTTDGTPLIGMFHRITVDASRTDIFTTGFTPSRYFIQPDTQYTVFASDCREFVFDHWEHPDSPGVPLTPSVSLKGTAVNSKENVNLVAVYRINTDAETLLVSSPTVSETVQVEGLPETGEVEISSRRAIGTGIINMAPFLAKDLEGMPAVISAVFDDAGTFTSSNGTTTYLAANTLLEVDTSTVVFAYSVTLTVPYGRDLAQASGIDENEENIRMFLHNGSSWNDITFQGSLDVSNGTIKGAIPAGLASPVVVGYAQR